MSALTAEQREHWRRHGWLHLHGRLTPDVEQALSTWVDNIAAEPEGESQRLHYHERTAQGDALCRTERFLADHPQLRKLIVEGILPRTAGELLGEEAVLYKEKINYKHAGGAGYAPHQDAAAYPYIKHHVTCLVAVDEMTAENGCLAFALGHDQGMLPLDDNGCIAPHIAENLTWIPLPLSGGDVLFFSSYTPHRSGPNHTPSQRRAIYLTYNAASEGDLREAYYRDRDQRMAAHMDAAGEETTARISTIGHFLGQRAD